MSPKCSLECECCTYYFYLKLSKVPIFTRNNKQKNKSDNLYSHVIYYKFEIYILNRFNNGGHDLSPVPRSYVAQLNDHKYQILTVKERISTITEMFTMTSARNRLYSSALFSCQYLSNTFSTYVYNVL